MDGVSLSLEAKKELKRGRRFSMGSSLSPQFNAMGDLLKGGLG